MPNKNRDKLNQPPTGEGKKQSPHPGGENKLHKRSEVLQATNVEQNIGTAKLIFITRTDNQPRAFACKLARQDQTKPTRATRDQHHFIFEVVTKTAPHNRLNHTRTGSNGE